MLFGLFKKEVPVPQIVAPVIITHEPIPPAKTLKELKALQKARAARQKSDRQAYKQAQRTQQPSPLKWGSWSLSLNSQEYRHHHIAYCLERGTPYERIEPKVHAGNEPDWKLVDQIRSLIQKEVPDATPVCPVST